MCSIPINVPLRCVRLFLCWPSAQVTHLPILLLSRLLVSFRRSNKYELTIGCFTCCWAWAADLRFEFRSISWGPTCTQLRGYPHTATTKVVQWAWILKQLTAEVMRRHSGDDERHLSNDQRHWKWAEPLRWATEVAVDSSRVTGDVNYLRRQF